MIDYVLRCQKCGNEYSQSQWRVFCDTCSDSSLLSTEYFDSSFLTGNENEFFSYAPWLPYENVLNLPGPTIGAFKSPELGDKIGLDNLWVLISGYAPSYGSESITGTFKELEAIGVLNYAKMHSDKTLIVSSAGNAAKAFLQSAALSKQPAVIVVPSNVKLEINPEHRQYSPLVIYLKDSHYRDAIDFVDKSINRFPKQLIRESGCFNVARRDSMAVPFIRSVMAMKALPDWYVQAVGSGTGVIASYEASRRLQKLEKFG